MQVKFSSDIKVAGIGMVPWTRLGLERWLPNYAIASLYGWDMPADTRPKVVALSDYYDPLPELPKINTPSLLANRQFQEMVDRELPGYDFMSYKPVELPPELAGRRILTPDTAFSDMYENKVNFRRLFAGKVPMPDFKVYDRSQLSADKATYETLRAGRRKFIIQDERLGGGRGSHVAADYEQYRQALEDISRLSEHERVVVSDFITDAKERSIQCCVTRDGVLTGPLQRQLIGHPLIANMQIVSGDKFCGAQIVAADQDTPLHEQVKSLAVKIGQEMKAAGYGGIFGVDFLVADDGKVYVLEVNPRITGMTPLLTSLYRPGDVPFYLLHMLELGGYAYTTQGAPKTFDRSGSLIVLHDLDMRQRQLIAIPASGTYQLAKGAIEQVSGSIDLLKLQSGQFIIQDYMPPNMQIRVGGRLAVLQFGEAIMDQDDQLLPWVIEVLAAVRAGITLRVAEEVA